jgi:type IV secretory pathway VirB4 component
MRRSRTCTCWIRASGAFANLLPRALAARLHKWVGEGRYASLFDNIEDTLTVERFQVFDLEAMRAYPVLLEPLLFYVLHRVVARVQDPSEAAAFKVCVLDVRRGEGRGGQAPGAWARVA